MGYYHNNIHMFTTDIKAKILEFIRQNGPVPMAGPVPMLVLPRVYFHQLQAPPRVYPRQLQAPMVLAPRVYFPHRMALPSLYFSHRKALPRLYRSKLPVPAVPRLYFPYMRKVLPSATRMSSFKLILDRSQNPWHIFGVSSSRKEG